MASGDGCWLHANFKSLLSLPSLPKKLLFLPATLIRATCRSLVYDLWPSVTRFEWREIWNLVTLTQNSQTLTALEMQIARTPPFLTVDMFGGRGRNGDDFSLVHFKMQNYPENNNKKIYSELFWKELILRDQDNPQIWWLLNLNAVQSLKVTSKEKTWLYCPLK